MKRLFVTLTLALSLVGMSSFAADETSVSEVVVKSFNSSFTSATEVNWSVTGDLYKADFVLNGQYVAAYFNTDGLMMATTRNISSTQLPIALQANLKKNYDEYWITNLFELSNEEGTSYYITLENADSKLVLKSLSSAEWINYKKVRKS
jgi:hypothetical protein